MPKKSFEDDLREVLQANSIRRDDFANELAEFDRKQADPVSFTIDIVKNCLNRQRKGFSAERRKRIVEYFQHKGVKWPSENKNKEARSKIAGDYVVIYDLDRKIPEGHSDILQARILLISDDENHTSKFKVFKSENKVIANREFHGELNIFFGSNPTSGIFVMSEYERATAPSLFFLSWIQIDEAPNECLMFGHGTGFDGDLFSQIISIRALAIPLHWFGSVPPIMSPETISKSAFDFIASFIRQETDGRLGMLATLPFVACDENRKEDVSQLCRQIRHALKQRKDEVDRA